MENKNVIIAKKELIQFLKKNNGVAVYFWTIYGHDLNSKIIESTFEKIAYETHQKILYQLYEDLIGKIYSNSNIKDKIYWDRDSVYTLYKKWCEHVRNKFHITKKK